MTRSDRPVITLLFALITVLTTQPASLAAQTGAARPAIWVQGGIAPRSDALVSAGLEVRGGWHGRVTPVLAVSGVWRTSGCDQLVGVPCDDNGWSPSLGALISLTPAGKAPRLYIAPRVGAIFRDGFERGVWNPSLGLGVAWTGQGAVGFMGEVRYNVVTDSRSRSTPNRPDTEDFVAFLVGLTLRM